MKVYVNGQKPITLDKKYYKAGGGEGIIYCKGNIAYKIYNDSKNLIPVEKIEELKGIQLDNVLAPIDILYDYDTNEPIGFTMQYIQSTEFLCKLFTKSFRMKNTISPEMITEIVTNMQKTLALIHKKNFLVVDYNEMNFLIDASFRIPYYIDVNSYQTTSFPATAIMDSVRDRLAPKNKFSELTDWFSFAIVTFQLYMGCHPYKGKHPDYTSKEVASLKMMDDNVSVFHPDVRLPATCQEWSVIPKAHYEWYKSIFYNNERSIPPLPDKFGYIAISKPQVITANDTFSIDLIQKYDSLIRSIYHFNGVRYAVTEKSIYAGKNIISDVDQKIDQIELCFVPGKEPIISIFNKNEHEVVFNDIHNTNIGKIHADAMMEFNGMIYTTHNGKLMENTFVVMSKIIHKTKIVCDIFEPSYTLFKGVAVQDIFSKCWMAIPYKPHACAHVHVKELDGVRIIDAQYESGNNSNVCIALVERDGNYERYTFCFNNNITDYTVRVDKDQSIDTINFTVLSNGLSVTVINDSRVEAFFNNSKIKIINDPPFDSSMKLINDGIKVLCINNDSLYRVSMQEN